MHDTVVYQTSSEAIILDYLTTHGQSGTLDISADLHLSPIETIKALYRLWEQGIVGLIKHPCPPS